MACENGNCRVRLGLKDPTKNYINLIGKKTGKRYGWHKNGHTLKVDREDFDPSIMERYPPSHENKLDPPILDDL